MVVFTPRAKVWWSAVLARCLVIVWHGHFLIRCFQKTTNGFENQRRFDWNVNFKLQFKEILCCWGHKGPDCTLVVEVLAGLRWLNDRYLALLALSSTSFMRTQQLCSPQTKLLKEYLTTISMIILKKALLGLSPAFVLLEEQFFLLSYSVNHR